jgi:hypothetical protein
MEEPRAQVILLMSEQPQAAPGGPDRAGHPELEELAALIDGRLPTAEAARVRAHLASCEDCYEVFAETLHLQEDLRGEEELEWVAASPFEERRKVRPLWAAAAAALLVVGVGVGIWWTEHSRETPDFSVAGLATPLAGHPPDFSQAWTPGTKRGSGGDKEVLSDALAFQLGEELFHLQLALESGDGSADDARTKVYNLLNLLPIPDHEAERFYADIRADLEKGASKDLARKASEHAQALRAEVPEVYFDLGAWAEAGRLATIAKKASPSRGNEAAYLLGQLKKDKDADLPREVITPLETIQKLADDDYGALKSAFEQILKHYYPEGHADEEFPATGKPSPEPGLPGT